MFMNICKSWLLCSCNDSLRHVSVYRATLDIRVCRPRRAPRKWQRRARDEETTTRQTYMGTYHRQTFRKYNKWRYTQVQWNRRVHPVHILLCWRWACTNINTQPRHTIIEARNSHMDARCDGWPDNCAECRLTTMHRIDKKTYYVKTNLRVRVHTLCTFRLVPSAVDRATRTDTSKNYMVNSSFACLHVVLRLTIDFEILVPLYRPTKCR